MRSSFRHHWRIGRTGERCHRCSSHGCFLSRTIGKTSNGQRSSKRRVEHTARELTEGFPPRRGSNAGPRHRHLPTAASAESPPQRCVGNKRNETLPKSRYHMVAYTLTPPAQATAGLGGHLANWRSDELWERVHKMESARECYAGSHRTQPRRARRVCEKPWSYNRQSSASHPLACRMQTFWQYLTSYSSQPGAPLQTFGQGRDDSRRSCGPNRGMAGQQDAAHPPAGASARLSMPLKSISRLKNHPAALCYPRRRSARGAEGVRF